MRRNFFHGSILGLIAIGLASVALAQQQPGSADRSSENQTLFDLLQSRLKASGLMPADEPEIVPIDESSYPSLGQRASTAPAANPRPPIAASSAPVGISNAGDRGGNGPDRCRHGRRAVARRRSTECDARYAGDVQPHASAALGVPRLAVFGKPAAQRQQARCASGFSSGRGRGKTSASLRTDGCSTSQGAATNPCPA